MFPRIALVAAACTAGALALAAPAAAHIDPNPTEAQAGSTLSVGFTVEHGCDGSPTVQLDMRLPDGVTAAAPDAVDGWDGSIDGNVVTFVGGPLADDAEGTFAVTMTLPPTPDTTIYFPFVQRCEVGEIRWIGIPTEPGDDLDEPAPALFLTGPAVTTTAPATTPAPSTPPAAPSTTTAPAPVESAVAATSSISTAQTDEAGTRGPLPNPDEPGNANTGTIIFILSIVAVGVVGSIAYVRSRSARGGQSETE